MANFTGLSAELNLCVLEQAKGFGDLVSLTQTTPLLRGLFKKYHEQIMASVSSSYTEEDMRFMRGILRAYMGQDVLASRYEPGINGKPLITYRVMERALRQKIDPIFVIRFYHNLELELGVMIDLCAARTNDIGYLTLLLDKPPSEVRRLYTTALWNLVRILMFALPLDRLDTDTSESSGDAERRSTHIHTYRIKRAKMYFAIQFLNKLPFEELVAVGDILIMTRNAIPSNRNTTGSIYAENRIFDSLSNYQTNGDKYAMLLLAHVWIMIRKHRYRATLLNGMSYRLVQFQVLENMSMEIDVRVFRGEKVPTKGEFPLAPRAHCMNWRSLKNIATRDFYDAVGR